MHNLPCAAFKPELKKNIKDKFQSRYIFYEGTGFIGKGVVGLSI